MKTKHPVHAMETQERSGSCKQKKHSTGKSAQRTVFHLHSRAWFRCGVLPLWMVLISCGFFVRSAQALERVIYVASPTQNVVTDTANVKAAMALAETAINTKDGASRSAVAVVFQAGTYVINERMEINASTIPGNDGGIMIRGAGANATVIDSGASNGALLVHMYAPKGNRQQLNIFVENIGFRTSLATCGGAAIEIRPYIGTPITDTVSYQDAMPFIDDATTSLSPLVTVPTLRNVNINGPFKYGFKGYRIGRSVMDNVTVNGVYGHTVSGFHFFSTYVGVWSDCTISNATYGVYSRYGGEGGDLIRSTVTGVDYGFYEDLTGGQLEMSNSGGGVRYCNITATKRAVFINWKRFIYVINNTFTPAASALGYKDVEMRACGYCHVHSNTFAGSARDTAVAFLDGDGDLSGKEITRSNMVHDNVFGTAATWVDIGAGAKETMIFNNGSVVNTTRVRDVGLATRISDGPPVPVAGTAQNTFSQKFTWPVTGPTTPQNVFDVSKYYNGGTSDTNAINTAIQAMVAYLNSNGANAEAYLYFPARTYSLNGTFGIAQQQPWGRICICGDGPGVSVIETSSTAGLFDVNVSVEHTPVGIHNLSLVAKQQAAGTAVKITGTTNGLTEASSLFMSDVEIDGKDSTDYFQIGVYGKTLKNPGLKNVSITMYGTAPDVASIPGSRGVQFEDVNGCESEGCGFRKRLERGLEIRCSSAATLPVQIRLGGAANCPDFGFWIDGGNSPAGIRIDGIHTNSIKTNIFLQNAKLVDCANFETLNYDVGDTDIAVAQSHSSIYLHSCQNVTVRDNTFIHSDVPYNINRRIVQADGGSSNLTISANHFQEPGGTGVWFHSNTTGSNSVLNNRFGRTDVEDIHSPNSTNTVTANLYQLNGENNELYLIRNVATPGGYLDKNLGATKQEIDDTVLWKITSNNATTGSNYTLTSEDNTIQLSAVITKKATGYCALNVAGLSGNLTWEPVMFGDLVAGFDHSTCNPGAVGTWVRFPFHRPFPFPPAVFVGGPSANSGDYSLPLTVRVSNVRRTDFKVKLQNWSDTVAAGGADLGFIATHKGSYNIFPSQSFEAGTITGIGTTWKTVSFKDPARFASTPCVFVQCMTPYTNDTSDPDPDPPACVRIKNVGPASFQVKIEASPAGTAHAPENLDYIAFEVPAASSGNEAAHGFQVGLTGATVNQTWSPVGFLLDNRDFSDVGIIGNVQSFNGGDPCVLRYQNLDKQAKSVNLRLDDPVSPTHSNEAAGWMVFENL